MEQPSSTTNVLSTTSYSKVPGSRNAVAGRLITVAAEQNKLHESLNLRHVRSTPHVISSYTVTKEFWSKKKVAHEERL